MSKKTVYVEDVVEALKELTAKEEFYVDPAESMFKMLEDLPSARCSDCITNGGDFECDSEGLGKFPESGHEEAG